MVGLREQKQARTRARIQDEALRLIAEQGYDATRCEQIAAAAQVSPATFFRYFATKEDVVLSDVYDPVIARAVGARPDHEGPLEAIRGGFAAALRQVSGDDLEVVRQRTALILRVPALRARTHEQSRSLAEHLGAALVRRAGAPPDDLAAQVAAAGATAAVTVAVERWAHGGGDLGAHVDAALGALADVARAAGTWEGRP